MLPYLDRMFAALKNIKQSLSHAIFPHNCLGCGSDILKQDDLICTKCFASLPQTNFAQAKGNPVEKTFLGRLNIEHATASFYFTKQSLMQHLIKQLKYHSNQQAGIFLGNLLGHHLQQSQRFNAVDAIVPLPLNKKKQYKRGYNQAEVICKGIAEQFNRPVINNVSIRKVFTNTQTKIGRIKRWQNMDGVFAVANQQQIEGKHILLVDDVITTGATLESCGYEILKIEGTKLSVACVAMTI